MGEVQGFRVDFNLHVCRRLEAVMSRVADSRLVLWVKSWCVS
jgi:hypothetical protein